MKIRSFGTLASAALVSIGMCGGAMAQQADMSFFVTSVGSGKGADFGGLAGADKHCQTLAAAAGAGGKTWRAYLSASAAGSSPAVNARDRIGKGPWKNAKGVVIAKDVAELHGTNNLTKQTALTEKGGIVNGRGDTPNQHDILTGTQPDGTAFAGAEDKTCGNWTKSGARVPRSSVMPIARGSTPARRRCRGIRRIRPKGAATPGWYPPAVPGTSTASSPIERAAAGSGRCSRGQASLAALAFRSCQDIRFAAP